MKVKSVSLCETNRIKFKQRFFVLFIFLGVIIIKQLINKQQFQLVELFSRANEVKPCGLVQQLILRMLRDLILQYSDSYFLNGNRFDDHLLKVLACLLLCLDLNQVIILWKLSKRN